MSLGWLGKSNWESLVLTTKLVGGVHFPTISGNTVVVDKDGYTITIIDHDHKIPHTSKSIKVNQSPLK